MNACPRSLTLQYKFASGKIEIITGAEYKRTLLFASIFNFKPDAEPPPHDGKKRRPRIRSMAEWREFQRRKDLRRLARADPELRRELLNTMDTCPCCERKFGHNGSPSIDDFKADETPP